jgi:hypothetical protein
MTTELMPEMTVRLPRTLAPGEKLVIENKSDQPVHVVADQATDRSRLGAAWWALVVAAAAIAAAAIMRLVGPS